MLCKEIITVCSEIHQNTMMYSEGKMQNFLMFNLVAHAVTTSI
jgi:hypothetical protein